MDIIPVIMAGGCGSRLWPLSRTLHPKQLLKLTSDYSLLQETVRRLEGLTTIKPLVICNEEHRFVVAEQLRELDQLGTIILEPVGRNTAPAIALAAIEVLKNENPDALILVLAADHVIEKTSVFQQVVRAASARAKANDLVTFGILPDHPETGYGYIRRGSPLSDAGFEVAEFVEKPDLYQAQHYIESGDYFWNSGMFLFKPKRYLEELEKFRPDILRACQKAMEAVQLDLDFIRIDRDAFCQCPDDSIDYAVMENTDSATVMPMGAGWSDVGSWSALWEVSEKDELGNTLKGDVITHGTQNSYINTQDKLVATVGLDNIVVVETKDAVLVAHKDKVQDIKKIVEELKSQGRNEVDLHREVYRPWGKYDSIDTGSRHQVKHITVKPGEKLSIQMHHHRAEHWIVVSGTAKVTKGKEVFLLTENESTYIPVGERHALENPGKVPLDLIEVQSGSYLGEDDIVRFEDRYGRIK
ncbi:mannose-1-phosphate guanylyltransferase/mannose-6-phosphate isomerase [Vibrio sp. Of7-15]|uniref:mannose-1-phosphate guanylyltransferase/mannose-6-phosphate isomerase n=1 Tax=Vibrio sp. Of7-15 TaxID=2724879 RepID=UPI001EF2C945|nr:mannose-1-phosphate guanylyltransferase/mannose-6-phosphate isomerase [Vibrio sp. Of7-15]MCG7495963.1 mannose-1-phosphate guanylyltransferase/mannose-6-phosphate isomerase [Vibrio sp. Of7-15]